MVESGGAPSDLAAAHPRQDPRDAGDARDPGDDAREVRDDDGVRALLGRRPAGQYEIVVRNAAGDPVVIKNSPLLDDGTPMPTLYWLVGRDEVAAVSRLESTGGGRAAEAAVDPAELEAAHARYAAERDRALPEHADPRPSGGVGGTRRGVKCLHAHYAWHLAGGDDPVGRWVAAQLAGTLHVEITSIGVSVRHATTSTDLPISPQQLAAGELAEHDPPSPISLTNALGLVTDHLDDVLRDHPAIIDVRHPEFAGDEAWHLASVEQGTANLREPVTIAREDLEDLFRTLATEPRRDRLHNPGLQPERVDLIIATCCTTLAIMRRLLFSEARFVPPTPLPPTSRLDH